MVFVITFLVEHETKSQLCLNVFFQGNFSGRCIIFSSEIYSVYLCHIARHFCSCNYIPKLEQLQLELSLLINTVFVYLSIFSSKNLAFYRSFVIVYTFPAPLLPPLFKTFWDLLRNVRKLWYWKAVVLWGR